MKKKHTSGPWTFSEDEGEFVFSEDLKSICSVFNTSDQMSDDLSYKEGEEQQHANAKLIAAAPDLLEACENAVKILSKAIKKAINNEDEIKTKGEEK